VVPIADLPAIDTRNDHFADMPFENDRMALAPVDDAPLDTAALHDDLIQWPSESSDDVPLRADATTPVNPPEPVIRAATDRVSERRNGLFAASAKGEVARANDLAALARDEAVRAKDEAARAREEAELAKAEAARVRDAAARAQRVDPVIRATASPVTTANTLFSAAEGGTTIHPSSKRVWIPLTIAAALAIGLLTGFGSGYFVAQNRPSPPPSIAAPEPTATNGQAYTESPLRESGSVAADPGRDRSDAAAASQQSLPHAEPSGSTQSGSASPSPRDADRPSSAAAAPRQTPVPQDTAREARARTAEARSRTPKVAESTTGTLFVDSHPAGVEVYVDDVLVGRTPLLLNDVRAGEHRVRMSMPTYRTWATSVDVIEGERTRVAASLEQAQE
jgi:hypothetical protein